MSTSRSSISEVDDTSTTDGEETCRNGCPQSMATARLPSQEDRCRAAAAQVSAADSSTIAGYRGSWQSSLVPRRRMFFAQYNHHPEHDVVSGASFSSSAGR